MRMPLNKLSSASWPKTAYNGRPGEVNRLRSLRRMNACIRCPSLGLAKPHTVDHLHQLRDDDCLVDRLMAESFIPNERRINFQSVHDVITLCKCWFYSMFTASVIVEEHALKWFHLYLNDRTQVISVDGKECAPIPLACSVPQGSVLGPVQFISYSEDGRMSSSSSTHTTMFSTTRNCSAVLTATQQPQLRGGGASLEGVAS